MRYKKVAFYGSFFSFVFLLFLVFWVCFQGGVFGYAVACVVLGFIIWFCGGWNKMKERMI